MRQMLLPLLLILGGCTTAAPAAALMGAEAASVAVFGRGLLDIGISAVSGRNCSVVRLERGLTYCEPVDLPPADKLCTRTLGTVDCWAEAALPQGVQGVGDTPAPSSAQLRYRAARWPKSLTAP